MIENIDTFQILAILKLYQDVLAFAKRAAFISEA